MPKHIIVDYSLPMVSRPRQVEVMLRNHQKEEQEPLAREISFTWSFKLPAILSYLPLKIN